jgi:flavin-dependent dehydrogenase
LSCVKALAKRGVSVCVLERKENLRHSIHTTGILVKEAHELLHTPEHLVRRIKEVKLYSPSLKSIAIQSNNYEFYVTDTPALMEWMADDARAAGAEIRLNNPLISGEIKENNVLVNSDLESTYLIGADGARSKVADIFNLGKNTQFLTGVEVEATGIDMQDALHCLIDRNTARGYIGWAFESVGGIAQIGIACNDKQKPEIKVMMDLAGKLFDMKNATIVARRGGLIPVGGVVRPFANDRVILVGDAGGMVSPLTAGGIHTALHYGAMLGEMLADHLQHGAPYPAVQLQKLYPNFGYKHLLRSIMDIGVPNKIMEWTLFSNWFKAFARKVFFTQKKGAVLR